MSFRSDLHSSTNSALSSSSSSDSFDDISGESQDSRTITAIDLLHLIPEHARLMAAMLAENKSESEFYAGDVYDFEVPDPADAAKSLLCHLTLSHNLKCRKHNGLYRYDVIGDVTEKTASYEASSHHGVIETKVDGSIEYVRRENSHLIESGMLKPLELTPDNNKFLFELLENLLIDANKDHPGEIKNEIFLDHYLNSFEYLDKKLNKNIVVYAYVNDPIISRRSNHNPAETRYEILGKHFASGAYGHVYYGIGTLSPSVDGMLLLKKHWSYATKELKHNTKNPVQDVMEESRLSRMTPHTHCKKPSIVDINGMTHSFTTSQLFPGKELWDVLSDQRKKITPRFSIQQRLKLMHMVLAALKEQIHACDIIHRDLKCENIVVAVDKDNNPAAVNIIDMGLAKHKNYDDRHETVGTFGYMPAETFDEEVTDEKSDVFSIGVVLGDILGRKEPNLADSKDHKKKDAAKAYKTSKSKHFTDLFTDLFKSIGANELTDDQRVTLIKLLRSMTRHHKADRCDLAHSIQILEQLCFELKLNVVDMELHAPLLHAHQLAIKLRDSLFKNADLDCAENFPVVLLKLNGEIKLALADVSDDPVVLQHFLETAGLSALRGLTDKTQILSRADAIASSISAKTKALGELLIDVKKQVSVIKDDDGLLKKLSGLINTTLANLYVRRCTFDYAAILDAKLEKSLKLHQVQFLYCLSRVQSGTSQQGVFASGAASSSVPPAPQNANQRPGYDGLKRF